MVSNVVATEGRMRKMTADIPDSNLPRNMAMKNEKWKMRNGKCPSVAATREWATSRFSIANRPFSVSPRLRVAVSPRPLPASLFLDIHYPRCCNPILPLILSS